MTTTTLTLAAAPPHTPHPAYHLGPVQDLLLVHWPGAAKTPPASPENARLRLDTWRVLEEAYGRVRQCRAGVARRRAGVGTEV